LIELPNRGEELPGDSQLGCISVKEDEMRVAIQGELGSFSHEAALRLVTDAVVVPCSTAAEVLRALDESTAQAAVIPVENSLAGSVIDLYDLFSQHEFAIERELEMRIRHNLMAVPGTRIESVRQAFSHPVALAQCKGFFADHPQIAAVPYYDTAGSVAHVMQERRTDLAAIASLQAAAQYGAEILAEGIEDRSQSYTRFWLIRHGRPAAGGVSATKLSLVFSLENRPGALLGVLSALAARRLNLTKIESRPIPGRPWEYMFYADLAIGGDEDADSVLRDLDQICPVVKELGRYPAS
jgi:prephenate dehydratase